MADRDTPAQRFLRKLWGDEAVDQIKALTNGPGRINSAASDRAEHERQKRQVDAEKLRQAEEDEQRRFPDK